jgi:tetratricopeptide (TPR) repeat protein
MLRADIYAKSGMDKLCLEALDRAESLYASAQGKTFTYSLDEIIAARASALTRLGKNDEALSAYKKTSTPAVYNYQMAVLNERLGKIPEARALLQQVVSTGTDPAQVQSAKDRLAQDPYRKKP